VLAPSAEECIRRQLNDTSFISVSSDASNWTPADLTPIMVRFFHPIHGIKVKLLEVYSVEDEISNILDGISIARPLPTQNTSTSMQIQGREFTRLTDHSHSDILKRLLANMPSDCLNSFRV
jgi:hypothetical protein